MESFRLVIQLNLNEENPKPGKILMYSGTELIQNDPIDHVVIKGNTLTFLITAKESSFEGSFDDAFTELSGDFIFPDQSKHQVKVRKVADFNQNSTADQATIDEILVKQYSPEELREDLSFLVDMLRQMHPQLYRYTSETEHRQIIDEAFLQLDKQMSLLEFYHTISPVTDAVHCSHTAIRPPADFQQVLMQCGNYFPLKVFASKDGLYLLDQMKELDPGIESGTPIKSINGITWEEILDDLFDFIPSEGFCQTTKYNALNSRFSEYYQLLDNSDHFDLVLENHGVETEVTVPAGPHNPEENPLKSSQGLPVKFSIDPGAKTAILKMISFQIMNMEGYLSLLDSLFQKLRNENIEHLVVDLRDNQGGHPIFAAQILSYLTSREFTYFKRVEGLDEFEPLYGPMQANKNFFEGKVCVLVNGGCLSTTGHLISLLDHYTESIFIGEQPGSTYRCNDFSKQIRLPNTGIEANIPRSTFETAVPDSLKKETFIPEYLVESDPLLNSNDVDPFMERASQLIQSQSDK